MQSKNTSPTSERLKVRIKRESWNHKYHSVARDSKGHFVAVKRWTGAETTRYIREKAVVRRVAPPPVSYPPPVARIRAVPPAEYGRGNYSYVITCRTKFGLRRAVVRTERLYPVRNRPEREALFRELAEAYFDPSGGFVFENLHFQYIRDDATGKRYYV